MDLSLPLTKTDLHRCVRVCPMIDRERKHAGRAKESRKAKREHHNLRRPDNCREQRRSQTGRGRERRTESDNRTKKRKERREQKKTANQEGKERRSHSEKKRVGHPQRARRPTIDVVRSLLEHVPSRCHPFLIDQPFLFPFFLSFFLLLPAGFGGSRWRRLLDRRQAPRKRSKGRTSGCSCCCRRRRTGS